MTVVAGMTQGNLPRYFAGRYLLPWKSHKLAKNWILAAKIIKTGVLKHAAQSLNRKWSGETKGCRPKTVFSVT